MEFKLSICSLNQWALDFPGNSRRIKESIDIAHRAGAAYRAGPELEICGYSLEDAFFEQETVELSWVVLMDVIQYARDLDMIIDLGMPIHNTVLYNCRVIALRGRILCIRAKTSLAAEGNYREFRYFAPWPSSNGPVPYKLPSFVSARLSQEFVPFGADFILELGGFNRCDTIRIGWEICQELWDSKNISSDLYQNFGCHLVLNGSASYWELRKLGTVTDMIKGISLRGSACYAFSNLVGCDGQRYIFYGRSCIYDRGTMVAMTSSSSECMFDEVQVIHHVIQPRIYDECRARSGFRTRVPCKTWNLSDMSLDLTRLDGSYKRFLLNHQLSSSRPTTIPHNVLLHSFEQEIETYVPLWLWDYLRRSRMSGFMLALSGGLDSTSVASLVYVLSRHLHRARRVKPVQIYFQEVHRINQAELDQKLSSPKDICKLLLRCCYLSTKYSGNDTQRRAEGLCDAIGAEFSTISIQDIYSQFRNTMDSTSNESVSLLDQNMQARLRMVATYHKSDGCRIVLAAGNVDEAIMGYLTKYDCSSADINPIGGLCKNDLKSFLRFCCTKYPELAEILSEVIDAPPSAELTGSEQRDEDEIGVTYDEISVLGCVRRGQYACSGPKGAFEFVWSRRDMDPFCNRIRCLRALARGECSLKEAAVGLGALIKQFYSRYSRNRHKLTVLTPALHAETYSPDDNRFDHRHFLFAPYTLQFKLIDDLVSMIE